MVDINDIRQEIIRILESEKGIFLCILFGSALTGKMSPDSDIDIAISGIAPFDVEFIVALQLKLARALRREVDIVDLSKAEGMINWKIFEHGKVLMNRDSLLTARLIQRAISYSADMLPYVRMILQKRALRFSRGF